MHTTGKSWIAAVGLLGVLVGTMVAQTGNRRPEPLNEHVVVDYSDLKRPTEWDSGIFRNEDDPPDKQFISEKLVMQKLPGGAGMGFLRIIYVVEGDGVFNGYWWKHKKGGADWSRFENDGRLVLRLAMGTKCTPTFKLELKTTDKAGGPVTVFPVYVWLATSKAREAMKANGYADVSIPLKDFRGKRTVDPTTLQVKTVAPNLKHVTEFTVVFEQSKIPAGKRRGVLLINSIRLVGDGAGK